MDFGKSKSGFKKIFGGIKNFEFEGYWSGLKALISSKLQRIKKKKCIFFK